VQRREQICGHVTAAVSCLLATAGQLLHTFKCMLRVC
jgi:hypothetical protein